MKPLFPDVFVNGEKIPSAAIAAEAQNHKAPKGKPGLAWHAAARALVVRKLLLQEVIRDGLDSTPIALGPDKAESEEEAMIRAYLEVNLQPEPISEAEIDATVARHKDHPDANIGNAREQLEQIAWAKAANALVNRLVGQSEITGTDMTIVNAA